MYYYSRNSVCEVIFMYLTLITPMNNNLIDQDNNFVCFVRSRIEFEPSYVKCEELYPSGRMSFKNFNPTVEVSLCNSIPVTINKYYFRS